MGIYTQYMHICSNGYRATHYLSRKISLSSTTSNHGDVFHSNSPNTLKAQTFNGFVLQNLTYTYTQRWANGRK